MIAIKGCMLLWLVGVELCKAPESFIDGTTVVGQHAPADATTHEYSTEQLDKVSHELIDGGSSDLKTRHSYRCSSRKRLREEFHNNPEDRSGIVEHRLLEERRAGIRQNLSSHQKRLASLKAEGEPMRKLFDVLMRNEDMLNNCGRVAEEESIPFILIKLKGVQRDINELIQIRLRNWAGLGGKAFGPGCKKDKDSPSEDFAKDTSDASCQIQLTQQLSSGTELQSSMTLPVEENSIRAESLSHQAPQKGASETTPEVEAQEELQSQLDDNLLEIIYKKVVATRVQDLNEILHSIKFPDHASLHLLMYMETIRPIKLCFEKTIFQAIGLMYKFGLIEEENFKIFFSTSKTLELIGKHLVDLFPVAEYGLFHPLAFVPDIQFLSNHWQTKHLHEILNALEMAQQARVISSALFYNVELSGKSHIVNGAYFASAWSVEINRILYHRDFFSLLESMRSGEPSSQKDPPTPEILPQDQCKILTRKMINFFQELINSRIYRGNLHNLMEVEFFLKYHFLHFIKTYYSEFLGDLFHNPILEKQLLLVQECIKLHDIIKQAAIHNSIMASPEPKFHLISREDARMERDICMERYTTISQKYKDLEMDLGEASKEDTKAQYWFKGKTISGDIFLSFSRKSTGWDLAQKMEINRSHKIWQLQKRFKIKHRIGKVKDPELFLTVDPGGAYVRNLNFSNNPSNIWIIPSLP